MSNGLDKNITPFARHFLEPTNTTHRQYEALRAYFVEGLPSAVVARRFGYTPGSFRVLCTQFRHRPERPFFIAPTKGPRREGKADPLRERVIALRKQNLSIYDISAQLTERGPRLSPAAIALILKEEGFARLPRRREEERPAGRRPTAAAVADVRELDLSARQFRTRFGGLFLFLPTLARVPLEAMLEAVGFPGSAMISRRAVRCARCWR